MVEERQRRRGEEGKRRREIDERLEARHREEEDRERAGTEHDEADPVRATVALRWRFVRRPASQHAELRDDGRDHSWERVGHGHGRREHREKRRGADQRTAPRPERRGVEIDDLVGELRGAVLEDDAASVHEPGPEQHEGDREHGGRDVSDVEVEQHASGLETDAPLPPPRERPQRTPHRDVDRGGHPSDERHRERDARGIHEHALRQQRGLRPVDPRDGDRRRDERREREDRHHELHEAIEPGVAADREQPRTEKQDRRGDGGGPVRGADRRLERAAKPEERDRDARGDERHHRGHREHRREGQEREGDEHPRSLPPVAVEQRSPGRGAEVGTEAERRELHDVREHDHRDHPDPERRAGSGRLHQMRDADRRSCEEEPGTERRQERATRRFGRAWRVRVDQRRLLRRSSASGGIGEAARSTRVGARRTVPRLRRRRLREAAPSCLNCPKSNEDARSPSSSAEAGGSSRCTAHPTRSGCPSAPRRRFAAPCEARP